jgi:hypothetical protein
MSVPRFHAQWRTTRSPPHRRVLSDSALSSSFLSRRWAEKFDAVVSKEYLSTRTLGQPHRLVRESSIKELLRQLARRKPSRKAQPPNNPTLRDHADRRAEALMAAVSGSRRRRILQAGSVLTGAWKIYVRRNERANGSSDYVHRPSLVGSISAGKMNLPAGLIVPCRCMVDMCRSNKSMSLRVKLIARLQSASSQSIFLATLSKEPSSAVTKQSQPRMASSSRPISEITPRYSPPSISDSPESPRTESPRT